MTQWMPILGTPFAVRMDTLNEAQAQHNHGQSLAKLASRGGLSMSEAAAIALRQPWTERSAPAAAQALTQVAPQLPPGMAAHALAGEIVSALEEDDKDGGYDLTAGMFGQAFTRLIKRWATLEFATNPNRTTFTKD